MAVERGLVKCWLSAGHPDPDDATTVPISAVLISTRPMMTRPMMTLAGHPDPVHRTGRERGGKVAAKGFEPLPQRI